MQKYLCVCLCVCVCTRVRVRGVARMRAHRTEDRYICWHLITLLFRELDLLDTQWPVRLYPLQKHHPLVLISDQTSSMNFSPKLSAPLLASFGMFAAKLSSNETRSLVGEVYHTSLQCIVHAVCSEKWFLAKNKYYYVSIHHICSDWSHRHTTVIDVIT